MNSQVCCVLVNFKAAQATLECLQSLIALAKPPEWVMIVDNGSPDSSVESLRKGITAIQGGSLVIHFLANPRNAGFAAGCNLGMQEAQRLGFRGSFWFLNNDTLVERGALAAMIEVANRTGADLVGSQIVTMSESQKPVGGAGKISPWTGAVGPILVSGLLSPFQYIEGSSLLLSENCIQTLAGLPEDYFLYFEESDYCLRAHKAGLKLAIAQDSVVRHHVGLTTGSGNLAGQVPFFSDCLMIRNRMILSMRHGFFPLTLWLGFLYSLGLRVVRGQWDRVVTICRILSSKRQFELFLQKYAENYTGSPSRMNLTK